MVSEVQSVLFDKKYWDVNTAIQWLITHGFAHDDIDIKKRFIRFRQHDPSMYRRMRTKKIYGYGIDLVIGFL